ncbi:amino acid adenylation domain-containing protein [Streptomyces sp. NPDC059781]|uniref:non-ribosomal peptide synthetase n=1 Tax=Streptomyces sp. NPDC059781 TaxID=3346943 RepID=UPI003664A5B6
MITRPAPSTGATRLLPEAAGLPASGTQAGMWFINQTRPDVPLYSVPLVLRLTGELEPEAVRDVLHALPRRHDLLGLRFAVGPEGAVLVPADGGPDVTILDLRERPDAPAAWEAVLQDFLHRPQDLGARPGYRAVFASLDDRRHMLAIFLHHAYLDARSVEVLLHELVAELGSGTPPESAPVPYRRVAEWLRDNARGSAGEASRAYWRAELAEAADFRLPTDHDRPQERSHAAAGLRRRVPAEFMTRLERFCREQRATPFMVLASAYAVALASWQGVAEGADPVMSVPQTLRREEWLQDVVGPLLNSVPLRVPVDWTGTFRELLATTRKQAAGAMSHAVIGQDEILAVSGRASGRSEPAFTSVSFQVSEEVPQTFRAEGLVVEDLLVLPRVIDLDLTWDVRLDEDGGSLVVAYAAELFLPETVERLADEFLALTEALMAAPGVPLCQVSWRGEEDTARAWARGEGAPLPALPGVTVDEVFRQAVAAHPDVLAVVDGTHTWSYAGLDAAAELVAARLRDSGVPRGAVVALALPRGRTTVAAMLGVMRAGAVYAPLDPDEPAARTRAVVERVRPAVVLADDSTAEAAGVLGRPVVLVPDEDPPARSPRSAAPYASPERRDASPDDPCYVMCTSGTTGEPKALEITHRGVVSLAHRPAFTPVGPGDVVLQVAPVHFDASTFEIWGALLNGATLVVAPRTRLTGPELAGLVEGHGVTVLHLTAGLLRVVADGHSRCFTGLRTLLTGGDVVPVQAVRRVMTEHPGLRVVACYGPTENTTFSMVAVLDRPPVDFVPLGVPLAGRSAHLLDPWLRPVPDGAVGEIHVGGAGLARGYLGDAAATAGGFVGHPARPGERLYRTGDLARRRPDGTWQFLGRRDHQVKIRGVRVEPAEVESALLRHPGVRRCVVLPRGASGDLSLTAYAVVRPGTPVAALREHLLGLLPVALVPTGYVLLDELPLTPQGKVDAVRLGRLPLTTSEDATAEPAGPTEERVRDIWCATLRLENVSVCTDFFEAGGHSLAALAIAGLLEREFGRRVPVSEVLRRPTVRALAAWLDSGGPSSATPAQRPRPSVRLGLDADIAAANEKELAVLQRLVPGYDSALTTEGSRS